MMTACYSSFWVISFYWDMLIRGLRETTKRKFLEIFS